MNIGLIGSGGREHASRKFYDSKLTKKIYCFPGNAGTSGIATNIDVNVLILKNS